MTDTIFALSSGPGRSAVAVIRVSGPAVRPILRDMAGGCPEPRQAVLRRIVDPPTDVIIDEGLVLFFAAPASATGEDLAEMQVHGGRAVLQAIFAALSRFDQCRPAEPGEFARRAFDNGKLDLTAAEGIIDLIDAETEAQRRQARMQAGGALASLYDGWRDQLIQAQALVEAAIDFSDEGDVGENAFLGASKIVQKLATELTEHLARAQQGEIIRSGFRVVIAGPPNAGKSSLLNAMSRREAAIVSDEAGTTRDVIEVHMDLGGLPVIISDTAGIRETSLKVEQEGIRRTLDRARNADLVLWMIDPTSQLKPTVPQDFSSIPVLEVRNKIDIATNQDCDSLAKAAVDISAKLGTGIDKLVRKIIDAANDAAGSQDQAVPTNARHRTYLQRSLDQLEVFLAGEMHDLELRAEDLRISASALGRLTGRVDVEDILDQIFSRFCVGK